MKKNNLFLMTLCAFAFSGGLYAQELTAEKAARRDSKFPHIYSGVRSPEHTAMWPGRGTQDRECTKLRTAGKLNFWVHEVEAQIATPTCTKPFPKVEKVEFAPRGHYLIHIENNIVCDVDKFGTGGCESKE